MRSFISTFFVIIKGILSRKTITRSLMDDSLREIVISGQVLDLGSKTGKSSYYKYIKQLPSARITFTDLFPSEGVVACDVAKKFPFPDNQFDFVLALNLMEHVYEYENIIIETFRVLRDEGTFIGFVPFIHHYHPDPDDYFRFTHSALKRLLTENGFIKMTVTANSVGPVTCGTSMVLSALLPKWLSIFQIVIMPICLLGDWLVFKLRRGFYKRENFAFGYIFVATKPIKVDIR
ncbi:MAG: class I SAM-dependent methyltransferase [Candidatus Gribaldobacteria bacterium]|nr:class I SAM-dependent methyltransferase [Candidatus Gribaldobacteria bacterium]